MKCKKCGITIEDNQKFCSQCGEKLEINMNNIEKNREVDKKSQPYLIIGIILAICCSLPFGVAIILINELKYKPLLREDNQVEADKARNLMIILMIVGIILGFIVSGLSFFIELITALE